MSDRGLTHLDPLGRARMVDVTPKEPTHRRAVARGLVHMRSETTSLVARGAMGGERNRAAIESPPLVGWSLSERQARDLCGAPPPVS